MMPAKAPVTKLVAGPALVLCIIAAMLLLAAYGIVLPNPVLFLSLAIVLSSSLGGTFSGLASVTVTFLFLLLYWSRPGHLFSYTPGDVHRLVIFVATMPAMALLVGALESSNRKSIADLKARTKAFAASQERLQRAEFVAGTGNWEVDLADGSLFASEGARRVYGLGDGDYSLADVQSLPLPRYRPVLDASLRDLLEGRGAYDVTFKLLRSTDGAVVDIHSRASFDPVGRKIFGTIQDVTAQKKTEADLVAAREKAEAANRAKSEFLANMSHEIRTPLNGILGMLQTIEDTPLSTDQRQLLAMAEDASRRLAQLLNDILDLSRVESGKLPLAALPFAPRELAAAIEGLFLGEARKKGIALECRLDGDMPETLLGDEARIRQILFNLVGNAVKFTERGGVTVTIAPLHRRERALRLLCTVSDTGGGMPDALLGNLCQPFTQGPRPAPGRPAGAGLGLSIVRKLSTLLGGELAIDSEEGRGTDVYLTLPLRLPDPAPAPRPCPPGEDGPACRDLRILLAEDDVISAMAGRRLLEKMGHAVTTVPNGQEAVDAVAGGDFDLVLMDIQMPVLDGIEATRRIRDRALHGPKADIPIIAMTAHAMAGDKGNFLAAAMDDYLPKPVDKSSLGATIGRVMETARRGFCPLPATEEPDA